MVGAAMMDTASKRYGLLFFGTALVLTVALGFLARSIGFVLAWVLATTVVALGAYGLDKLLARSDKLRVPERVLLALSFAGGTAGALAGMKVFHHKTAKSSFRMKFWGVTAAQVVLLTVYLIWIRPCVL
jgi:uncharacterized membrane protein YsdA (DUF1294 family)